MKAECYVQLAPRWDSEERLFVAVQNMTQNPPNTVKRGAAVVRLVFNVADDLFDPVRQYPTATIEVDKTVADIKPALVTAMAEAKF